MLKLFLIGSATFTVLGGFIAEASELPAFEKYGFPITRTQVAVLGSADVHESSPVPALTLAGMPASSHEVAVLTPRARLTAQAASKLTPVGFSEGK
jgi:hypothetical protein